MSQFLSMSALPQPGCPSFCLGSESEHLKRTREKLHGLLKAGLRSQIVSLLPMLLVSQSLSLALIQGEWT